MGNIPSSIKDFSLFAKAFSSTFCWKTPSLYLLVIFPILNICAFNPLFIAFNTIFSASNLVIVYIPDIFCPIYKSLSLKIFLLFIFSVVSSTVSSFSPFPDTLIVEICINLLFSFLQNSTTFSVPFTFISLNNFEIPKCFTSAPAFITVVILFFSIL